MFGGSVLSVVSKSTVELTVMGSIVGLSVSLLIIGLKVNEGVVPVVEGDTVSCFVVLSVTLSVATNDEVTEVFW